MDILNRFRQRVQENLAESTRDIEFGSNIRIADTPSDKLTDIVPKLSSNKDIEVIDALKRVLVLLSHSRDLSTLFPSIIKLISSRNFQIKILAYVYLTRYAKICPDLAMLSVNTFQKDSSHVSPLVRAQSIRVLSSISSEDVAPVCLLCVKRAAKDSNPYVRKAAALAIPKCYELDESSYEDLRELALDLMTSSSSIPIGSAIYAFNKIHPEVENLNDSMFALHPVFRHLVRQLVECEEWSQLVIIDLLARYSRLFLPKPESDESIDKDLDDFLRICQYLLGSQNIAVTAKASKTILLLGTPSYKKKALRCLLRSRKDSPEMAMYVLLTMAHISESAPESITSFLTCFFIVKDEALSMKVIKLNIIRNIMSYLNESQLITLAKELKCHMLDPDTTFAAQVIETIGYLTRTTEKASDFAFKVLASSSASSNKVLSQKSIIQLRNFIHNHTRQSFHLRKLLKRMFGGSIEDDDARAALIWIVSQIISNPPDGEVYNSGEDIIWKYAPDILRKSVFGFSKEGIKTQMQIINLAAKMMTSIPNVAEVHILARKVFMLSNHIVGADSTNLKHLDAQNRRQALVNTVRGVIGAEEDSTDEMPRIVLRRLQASLVLDTSTKDSHTIDKIASLPRKANPVKIQDDILMSVLPEWSKDDLPSADVRMETYPKGYPEESTSTPTVKSEIEPVIPLKDNSEVVEIPEADEDMLDDDLEKFLDSDSSSNLSDD